jgi:N-acetylmuramoyl-L-alanine amidase
MTKIIGVTWHWTAGADGINDLEKDHYNFIINREGVTFPGDFPPEAQIPANIKRGSNFYAAHTLSANSYRIGYAADAMAGAQERPLVWGSAPLTEIQIKNMMKFTAGLVRVYKLSVSRQTILSHAEIEPTLGIKQRQKWDITCLPGDVKVRSAVEVGDILRDMVQKALQGRL